MPAPAAVSAATKALALAWKSGSRSSRLLLVGNCLTQSLPLTGMSAPTSKRDIPYTTHAQRLSPCFHLLAQRLEPQPFVFRRREVGLRLRERQRGRIECGAVAGVEIRLGDPPAELRDLGFERRDARRQR